MFDAPLQPLFNYIFLFNFYMLRNQIKCCANWNHWIVNYIYFGPQVHVINYIMCPPQEINENDCEKSDFLTWKNSENTFVCARKY